MTPEWIVIHHSFSADHPDHVNWSAIRRWHVEYNGWRDVGYHFGVELINGHPEILVGRMLNETGAHCTNAGMNRKSLGICVVGDFDTKAPSDDLLNALRKFTHGLLTVLDIDPERVIGHRDAGLMDGFDWRRGEFKTCPGQMFPLDEFKRSLI